MVLAAESPQIQLQCERLRRMVQHAHWLIEDAALALRLQGTELAPVCLQDHLIRIGTEMALHEERNLEICSGGALTRALMPAELTHAFASTCLPSFAAWRRLGSNPGEYRERGRVRPPGHSGRG